MDEYEGAEAFVEILNTYHVDNIFFNPGVDTVPVQVAVSKLTAAGNRAPKLILCLDESVAMSAAHGHYMASGKPQVVMVHAELGTMQVGGAMHNAQWGRVPVILWAGLLPQGNRADWLHEPYDQSNIVRNCVKWAHHLDSGENIHDILQQAFKTALTEPRGPVYLSYSLEILTKTIEKRLIEPPNGDAVLSTTQADLEKIARTLIDAEKPLILTGYTGRYHESVASLVELAETLSAPVLSGSTRMNFPTTHPLFGGRGQIGGRGRTTPYVANADVILVIDYDTPYVSGGVPKPDTQIIHIDIDALTQGRQLWGKEADIFIKDDSRIIIPALKKIISQMISQGKPELFRERWRQLEFDHNEQRHKSRDMAMNKAEQKPISPDWLCRCISEVIDEDTIILNQTISHSASVAEQIDRTQPGTLLACAGGSIQWALGASLGTKLASPQSTVVNLVTDGGFVWGCPVATLWSAVSYKAPFLSIIFNNQSYGAIRGLVQRAYGEYILSDEMAFDVGVDIAPPPDYASIARDCGAYGLMVEDPADVLPALRDAISQVRSGKPTVVDVRLSK